MDKTKRPNTVTSAIIIAVAIIIATLILAASMHSPGEKDSGQGNIITMSARQYMNSMTRNEDENNSQVTSSYSGANSGDVIIVKGVVTDVGCINNDSGAGFIYSYVTLNNVSSTTGIDFFFLGNLTGDFQVGDTVEISLHVIECQGTYDTFWGGKVTLDGEFLTEDFYYGMYITQPIIPRNDIQKV